MMRKLLSSLCCCFFAVCVNGQTEGFKFTIALDSVKTSGFYSIDLNPALAAHLKLDFSDLRIVNDSWKWIPHVINNLSEAESFQPTPDTIAIINNTTDVNATTLVMESGGSIDNLMINIKSTLAGRMGTLAGSDNLNNWFVINDSIALRPKVDSKNQFLSSLQVYFPVNNYRYLRLVIRNGGKDPYNILSVYSLRLAHATGDQHPVNSKFQNPPISFSQKDSGKMSYIRIEQQQAFQFTNIGFKVSSSGKYFFRHATLYNLGNDTNSFPGYEKEVRSFKISNNSTLQYSGFNAKGKLLYMLIDNEDNPPLRVDSIYTENDHYMAVAYLEAGKKYGLILDNNAATNPIYDLTEEKIAGVAPIALQVLGSIKQLSGKEIHVEQKKSKWLLWLSIGAALIILLFITRKMVSEVDKTKDNDHI